MLLIKRTISHVYIQPISKPFYYPTTYHFYTTLSTLFSNNNNNNNKSNESTTTTATPCSLTETDKQKKRAKARARAKKRKAKANNTDTTTAITTDINDNESNESTTATTITPYSFGTAVEDSEKTKKQENPAITRVNKRKAKANKKAKSNPLINRLLNQSRLTNVNTTKAFSKPFISHSIQPKLSNEDKKDIDNSWTELSHTKYERVYPDKNIPVATLAHGLERTLFKTGIHPLRDFKSKKLLFSPYLESITQPDEFDYNAIQSYITSSQDNTLIDLAKKNVATFVGSTSSISGALSHIYYQISNHRPVDISFLSDSFKKEPSQYTRGARAPKTIYLKYKDNDVYAIDADKAFDEGTILSDLGKSMEKFLTLEPNEYERLLKENSSVVTEEEKNAPEAYAYGKIGDMVLRSQLDCYHRNLPRRTFDLKTRATMPVRLDKSHYQEYYEYTLDQHMGKYYSFEREYYDMMRSAFLKYNFQVRIGHMDGILVAYHNTNKIFGFQYISRHEMDARLFGTTKMGDEAFTNCLVMIQNIFKKAIEQYPRKSLRISLDASKKESKTMKIYIEPLTQQQEDQLNNDDEINDEKFHTEPLDEEKLILYELSTKSYLNDKLVKGPVAVNKESIRWDVFYQLEQSTLPQDQVIESFKRLRHYQSTVFSSQSDETPTFLEKFKLNRAHYHQERKLKEKKRKEEEQNQQQELANDLKK